MPYTYDYPRPMVTVDIILFSPQEDSDVNVLLIQRDKPPFEGKWAFPGGFMDIDETLETAAHRELQEETGLTKIKLVQMCTVSTLGRDPRGRTVTTVYFGIVDQQEQQATGMDDARDAKWFPLSSLPSLAFDHEEIIEYARHFYQKGRYKDPIEIR